MWLQEVNWPRVQGVAANFAESLKEYAIPNSREKIAVSKEELRYRKYFKQKPQKHWALHREGILHAIWMLQNRAEECVLAVEEYVRTEKAYRASWHDGDLMIKANRLRKKANGTWYVLFDACKVANHFYVDDIPETPLCLRLLSPHWLARLKAALEDWEEFEVRSPRSRWELWSLFRISI